METPLGRLSTFFVTALVLMICGVKPAMAVIVYDEATMGDLVGNDAIEDDDGNVLGYASESLGTFAPLASGQTQISSVVGTTDGFGADLFSFQIADGTQLDQLFLSNYTGDPNMFLAMQDSDVFPENFYEGRNAFINNSGQFFGGSIIGQSDLDNMIDVLPRIATAVGRGFDVPLGPGIYSVYLQQTTGFSDYQLDFSVSAATAVPEPGSLAIMALVGTVFAAKRRRR